MSKNSWKVFHRDLARGRWYQMSLAEQLGNIGSGVGRASKAQGKDQDRFESAVRRALELFNLTLSKKRWCGRLKEIGRPRDVFLDAAYNNSKEYQSSLSDLDRYFIQFALLARR